MKILVADDDPITRESLEACLKPEGFEVVLAQNGAEALQLWRKHRPDLLCLDIMMPQTSGYEVCREVRLTQPGLGQRKIRICLKHLLKAGDGCGNVGLLVRVLQQLLRL